MTYLDHNPDGSPYHSSISQETSELVALHTMRDSDSKYGDVLRIMGSVPPEIPGSHMASQEGSIVDSYWQSLYRDSMIPAYPAAGIGFGFKNHNVPFDATGGGTWVGIAFDMKLGIATSEVWVSMPMVGTDLPDPIYADAFPKECQYHRQPILLPPGIKLA